MVGTELRLPNNEQQRPEQQRPGQQRQESQVRGRPDRPAGPYSPNLSPESPALLPCGGASNIIATPGLLGDSAQDPMVRSRTQGLTQTNENGDRVANYTGQLNNGTIGYTGTTFTAQETQDRSGSAHSQRCCIRKRHVESWRRS